MSVQTGVPGFWTPVLYDVAHALESVQDPEARIDRVLALMHRFVPYDRCALLEAAPVLERPIIVAPDVSRTERDALAERLRALLDLLSEGPIQQIDSAAMPPMQAGNFHLAVPIIALGETTGIVFVERAVHPYEESHLAFLSVVAAQVGAYLAAVRADHELRGSEARREGLIAERERDIEFLEMFMGMLSHDLRNPLSAIRTSAEQLRIADVERLANPTNRILSSADRMTRMVEQLLDLTRIRLAGGIPIERQRVDLATICHRVIDELKAAKAEASFHLEVTDDVTGEWDGDRLLQVLSNLLSNAAQHAREPRVVTLRVVGMESAVEITTHNPGAIPDETLATLFRDYRGVPESGKGEGLGLGLLITKHIIDAHGGSIEVDSSEPDGTTFTVRLPRR